MRARYFRGLQIELECRHTSVIATDRYRISRNLGCTLALDAVRRGLWCDTCKAICQPRNFLRNVRL